MSRMCGGCAEDARLGAILCDISAEVGVEGVHLLAAAEKSLYVGNSLRKLNILILACLGCNLSLP